MISDEFDSHPRVPVRAGKPPSRLRHAMARARARLFLPAPAARTAGGWPKTVLAVSYARRAQAAKRFAALAPRLAEHGWIVPYGAATAEADGSITLDVCGQAADLLELIHVLDSAARVATRLVTGDHGVVPPA